jgi:ElaA protein
MHSALTTELSGVQLYRILQLRSEVFVVEQDCVYLDIDGRDLEPRTVQLWMEGSGPGVAATLRVLWDSDERARIGRVATASEARSGGLAARLIQRAVELAQGGGASEIVLDAQSHLAGWYGRFGFAVDGPTFVEDGIDHTPMRRVVR